MSNAIIRAALESRLKTWAAAQSPPIPIAYQNAPFTPPTQARYLRAFLLPAETDSQYVEGTDRIYMGLFQISICVPAGTGPGVAEQLVVSLESIFAYPLVIVRSGWNIAINRPLSTSPAMQEDGLYVLPVHIRYRADQA